MGNKTCKRCLQNKEIDDFYKNKKIKSGYESKCKSCVLEERNYKSEKINEYNIQYYKLNKEKINNKRIDKNKEYYISNKDSICEKRKEYYLNNRELVNDRNRKYAIENKEFISLYKKEWSDKNIEKRRERHKYRMENDNLYKIKHTLRSIIKRVKNGNSIGTFDILGCSSIEFKEFIESKFEDWMNWGNYGKYNGELNYGWDIDHIIPLSSALNEEELIKLSHYLNLQPLCSKINRYIKKDKINYENL